MIVTEAVVRRPRDGAGAVLAPGTEAECEGVLNALAGLMAEAACRGLRAPLLEHCTALIEHLAQPNGYVVEQDDVEGVLA